MDVTYRITPGKVVMPEVYLREPKPYRGALDGFCYGPSWFDPESLVFNLNHHEGCDCLATRSTCLQATHVLKMGLEQSFRRCGRFHLELDGNDCDEDFTFATYAFKHRGYIDRPMFKAMIELEDRLDSTAGMYPVKKRWHILRKILWISEPYREARCSGELNGMTGAQMEALVDRMHRRITRTLFGSGKEISPDTSYEILQDFETWKFVRETGQHARLGMGQDGIVAFASYMGVQNGGHRYVIGRRSKFVSWFPLPIFVDLLNAADGIAPDDTDRWGGNVDNIIGSPRLRASKIRPEQLPALIMQGIEIRKAAHPPCKR